MTAEPGERWRCFVGVPIGMELCGELTAFVARMGERPEARSLRWTDAAGWHVTLAFLGSVSPDAIPSIRGAVAQVAARHHPFALATGGLGAFPSPRDMRVLWYGIDDAAGQLRTLAMEVGAALQMDAGAFRAHLTLARSKEQRRGSVGLITLAEEAGDGPRGVLHVEQLDVYRSHLSKGPASYEVLASLPLIAP